MGNKPVCECKDIWNCGFTYSRAHVCSIKYDHDLRQCGYRNYGSNVTILHRCAELFCNEACSDYDRDGPFCHAHAALARHCQICHKSRINIRESDGICFECRSRHCNKCGHKEYNVMCDDCTKPCHGECGWHTGTDGSISPSKGRREAPPPCAHHAAQKRMGRRVTINLSTTETVYQCKQTIPYPGPRLCKECLDAKPQRQALIAELQACDA